MDWGYWEGEIDNYLIGSEGMYDEYNEITGANAWKKFSNKSLTERGWV